VDDQANVEVAVELGFGGVWEKTGVVGGTVSTKKVHEAELGETLPAESTALTRNVCGPCASPQYVIALAQATYEPPSSLH
jgi:hypothetical protein